jgi:hypothetical protein
MTENSISETWYVLIFLYAYLLDCSHYQALAYDNHRNVNVTSFNSLDGYAN